MKTSTIAAWEHVAFSRLVAADGNETEKQARQWHTLYRALLARIESGDRARAVLAQLRDDAEDYFVSPVFANIAYTAIKQYFEEPQP